MAKTYINTSGNEVPAGFFTRERKKEHHFVERAVKRAKKLHEQLAKFKGMTQKEALDIFDLKLKKGKVSDDQINFTLSNIERTEKVEVTTSLLSKIDDAAVQSAHRILSEFLDDGVNAKESAIKQMIMDAFKTSRGKLDYKRLNSLQAYRDQIADKRFKQACDILADGIYLDQTRTYMKFHYKDDDGTQNTIDLNFSSVKGA